MPVTLIRLTAGLHAVGFPSYIATRQKDEIGRAWRHEATNEPIPFFAPS
jgi:hypothetical protein